MGSLPAPNYRLYLDKHIGCSLARLREYFEKLGYEIVEDGEGFRISSVHYRDLNGDRFFFGFYPIRKFRVRVSEDKFFVIVRLDLHLFWKVLTGWALFSIVFILTLSAISINENTVSDMLGVFGTLMFMGVCGLNPWPAYTWHIQKNLEKKTSGEISESGK
jgi:hypothetical protein